jgi:hypothetical protein
MNAEERLWEREVKLRIPIRLREIKAMRAVSLGRQERIV